MRKTRLFLALVMCLTMTACKGGESGSTDSTEYNSEFEYVTLAELPADIEAAKKASYETFTVGDYIKVNIPEKISEMHISCVPFTEELGQKVVDHFGLSDRITVRDDGDPHNAYLVKYINGNERTADKSMHLEDNDKAYSVVQLIIEKYGEINYMGGVDYDAIHEESRNGKDKWELVFFDRAEEGQTVSFYNNTFAVSDLAKGAKTALDGLESVIGGLDVTPIYVKHTGAVGRVYCAVNVKGYYRPFCNAEYRQENTPEEYQDFIGIGNNCRTYFQKSTEPCAVIDDSCKTSAEYIGKEYEKMISMTSALKYLDSQLAPYMNLEMDHACLIQHTKDHPVMVVEPGKDPEKTDDNDLDYYNMKTDYESRPYWQFLFHYRPNEEIRYIAIIDCITGKMSFTKALL